MKTTLGAVALLFSSVAAADVSLTPWSQQACYIKRSTTSLGAAHADMAACQAALAGVVELQARGGNHFCQCTSGTFATYSAPVPPPPPPPPTPPSAGPAYYFSDCAAGAAPTCVPGNNANPGTEASPKQNLSGVSVNSLAAGTQLLFARGGAWSNFSLSLHNLNATLAAPLVLDAYGTGPDPHLQATGAIGVQFGGNWGNSSDDGGYTLRNLRIDGMGTGDRGLWFVQRVRGITLDNVTIEGFRLGIESSLGIEAGVTGVTIRNSRISNNRSMGILGSYSNSLIENSTFYGNNQVTGSSGNHAIYFSHGSGVTIRNNTFTDNSVVNGVCIGGNVTAHGVVDNLLIEGNTISVPAAAESCYGYAITAGYTSAEIFTNVVIRGNTIINVGRTSIGANASPGILVENNRLIKTHATEQFGIWIPANQQTAEDAADGNPIVRNNTICYAQMLGSQPVVVTAPGAQVSGNVVRTGADASTGPCAL